MITLRYILAAAICLSLGLATDRASAFRVIGAQSSDGTYCAGQALSCGTSATVMRWHRNFVPFVVNQDSAADNGDAAMNQAEIVNAAQAAYQSWEDVDGAIIRFVYGGQTSNRLSGSDRQNTTLWYNPAFDSGDCVGSMGASSGLLAMTVLTEIVETGEITDCDVIFDSADTWDWNMSCSSRDVESVLVHEYGHSIGIHHTELGPGTTSTRPSMYGTYFCDSGVASGRSLEPDDEAAAICLYPDLPTVVLLDKTGSMIAGNRMVDAKEAANSFIADFVPMTMAVAHFAGPGPGCEAQDGYDLEQNWTTSTTFLQAAINAAVPCGDTPLYESLCCAIDKAAENGPANVLVFTDTAENSSNGDCGCTIFADTYTKAANSDVRFYVIDMTDYAGTAANDGSNDSVDLPLPTTADDGTNLAQLASLTGGLYYKVNEQFALTNARANIADHMLMFGHRQQNPLNCFPEGRGIGEIQEYSGGCLPNSPVMGQNQPIAGRVTVERGMFDENVMYIQDCSGGMRIRGELGQFEFAKLGQEVFAYGIVDEYLGELMLENVVEFFIVDEEPVEVDAPILDPIVGGICEMIGELLTFQGYVAAPVDADGTFPLLSDLDVPQPQKLVVEIDPDTGIAADGIVPGDYILVTGVLGTEFGVNRLRPRRREDIVPLVSSDVDDVELETPVADVRSHIESVHPNPSRNQFQVEFSLLGSSRVRADVYDAQGREVRTLLDDLHSAGTHVVQWDGRDSAGSESPSGMYFVKLSTEMGSESKPMLLLR